jgi:serine/threonine protein kinase
MHSKFVTNLKYAFHNDETLFLVLDLMEGLFALLLMGSLMHAGGDLSYHLKKRSRFSDAEVWLLSTFCLSQHVWQSRFYAAEICMGLAHIHSRQMIYRDLKVRE